MWYINIWYSPYDIVYIIKSKVYFVEEATDHKVQKGWALKCDLISHMIKNSFLTGCSQVQPGASSNPTLTKCHFVPRLRVSRNLFSSSFHVYVNYFLKVFET